LINEAHNRVFLNQVDGKWLVFKNPVEILQTDDVSGVLALLLKIESRIAEGFHAAGFLSYEAAPAFDPALKVHQSSGFPLLWFGIYRKPVIDYLPQIKDGFQYDPIWDPVMGQDEYNSALARIKDYILSGDTYQVNFTFRMRSRMTCDPLMTFLSVQEYHPMPFSAYIDTGKHVICSFSPELFFRLDDNRISTRPMKGTAPRGRFIAEDRRNAEILHNSEKDRAENIMIVDMLRNDLGRIAKFNTVEVSDIFRVEQYQSVLQMTSTVSALTEAPISGIFKALFPCASVTGAPKVRTMDIIKELETSPRKIYCGAIGYISPPRKAVFNVAIRTLLIDNETGISEYGTGSGIVWDSAAGSEYEECLRKTEIITRKTAPFDLIETIRWSPEEGYFLFDRHIKRLSDSIRYFGFHADVSVIKEYIQGITADFGNNSLRVRVQVNREGKLSHSVMVLNKPTCERRIKLGISGIPVDSSDPFLFHKTTRRSVYTEALENCPGCDDAILWNERGEVTETTIGNIVIEADGRYLTPAVQCGLLGGTFREEMICRGKITETIITLDMLKSCDNIFRINSIRGWERAVLA
jgi:para-aminobenzoate synthetase/4-amino-4-deoxychorismate lyase